jgi:hypothetical protein
MSVLAKNHENGEGFITRHHTEGGALAISPVTEQHNKQVGVT